MVNKRYITRYFFSSFTICCFFIFSNVYSSNNKKKNPEKESKDRTHCENCPINKCEFTDLSMRNIKIFREYLEKVQKRLDNKGSSITKGAFIQNILQKGLELIRKVLRSFKNIAKDEKEDKENNEKMVEKVNNENPFHDIIKKYIRLELEEKSCKNFKGAFFISKESKDIMIEFFKSFISEFNENVFIFVKKRYSCNEAYHYIHTENESRIINENRTNLLHNRDFFSCNNEKRITTSDEQIFDYLTNKNIRHNEEIYVLYLNRIKMKVSEFIKLREILNTNNELIKFFSDIKYSFLCDYDDYLKVLKDINPDLIKYKIDGFTEEILKGTVFYIQEEDTDYYVSEKTMIKHSQSENNRTKESNCELLLKINDYKKSNSKILSNHLSRNLLVYITNKYINYDLKRDDGEFESDIYGINEFYQLYSAYLKNILLDLQDEKNVACYFPKLNEIKKEGEINTDKQSNWIEKCSKEFVEWKKQDGHEFKCKDEYEISRFSMIKEDLEIKFKFFFGENINFESLYDIKKDDTNKYCNGIKNEISEFLVNYLEKNKKDDLVLDSEKIKLNEELESKLEEEIYRFLLVEKSLSNSLENFPSHESKDHRRFMKKKTDQVLFKKLNNFIAETHDILYFLFNALKLYEKNLISYFNADIYRDQIERLEPVFSGFKDFKNNVENKRLTRLYFVRIGNNTLQFIKPEDWRNLCY